MRELGQLGVMAKKHHALQLVADLVNDVEQVVHRAGIQPIIHHDILELVIELLGDDLRRRERAPRRTRQDQSGFTSRFANRLPIFGASRLPRSPNGRSLSGNAVSSQLDFAWRMRNSVFKPHSRTAGETRKKPPENYPLSEAKNQLQKGSVPAARIGHIAG